MFLWRNNTNLYLIKKCKIEMKIYKEKIQSPSKNDDITHSHSL